MPLAKKKSARKKRPADPAKAELPLAPSVPDPVVKAPESSPKSSLSSKVEVNHPDPEGRIFQVLNWSPERLQMAQRWYIDYGYDTAIRSYPTADMAELLNLVKPRFFLVVANANSSWLCRRRLTTLVEKIEGATEDAVLLVSSSGDLNFPTWTRTK